VVLSPFALQPLRHAARAYFGWAILWGLVPQLAFHQLDPPVVAVLLGALDLWIMPFCQPALRLNDTWLQGEVVALLLVLLPALYIARWTLRDTHRNARCCLQLVTASLLFLLLLPELTFALRPVHALTYPWGPAHRALPVVLSGWTPLFTLPRWERQLGLQLLLLLALPGVSAVTEFALRGHGTPIPYDPPRRLVVSGIYRYCANPMQLSCSLVLLVWAGLLRNPWLLLPAGISTVYSAGIAEWDEARDLALRFPRDYPPYRRAVAAWLPRWKPYVAAGPHARLYISHSCNPCSHLLHFLVARNPLGLDLIPAESLPSGSIRRLRYDPADGTLPVEGLRAVGRALEHLHLGWAYCGMLLRLPVLWPALQLVTDAIGLGPRTLTHRPPVARQEQNRLESPPTQP
jgi:protein-S-isoprenylcysteine O-methyltransferase Ste14